MSNAARATLLLALLLVAPAALSAQDARVWRDSSERLATHVRALRDSMLRGDSSVREVRREGDLIIGASEQLMGTAARAFRPFVEARSKWFGGATPSPDGFRIVLRSEDAAGRLSPLGVQQADMIVLTGLPDSGNSVHHQRVVRDEDPAEILLDSYAVMMYASAGEQFVRWLDLSLRLSMPERERRSLAMYAVVTGTGRAQRGCVSGDLGDCAYALSLRGPAKPEPGGAYPAFVRSDVLLTALELGGTDAWRRLSAEAPAGLEAALAAAAGMPLDSLLARWRSSLLALRPTDRPLAAGSALLALSWVGILLLSALGAARWA